MQAQQAVSAVWAAYQLAPLVRLIAFVWPFLYLYMREKKSTF
jgi:hypothetical protein